MDYKRKVHFLKKNVMFLYVCAHVNTGACEGERGRVLQKRELQAAVSHLIWVLGTKFQSSARATQASFPAPKCVFLKRDRYTVRECGYGRLKMRERKRAREVRSQDFPTVCWRVCATGKDRQESAGRRCSWEERR